MCFNILRKKLQNFLGSDICLCLGLENKRLVGESMDFKREQEVKVCTGIFNTQERLISCESPTTFSNIFNLMRGQKNIFIQFSMTVKTMHGTPSLILYLLYTCSSTYQLYWKSETIFLHNLTVGNSNFGRISSSLLISNTRECVALFIYNLCRDSDFIQIRGYQSKWTEWVVFFIVIMIDNN